jgi:hypothetical protein
LPRSLWGDGRAGQQGQLKLGEDRTHGLPCKSEPAHAFRFEQFVMIVEQPPEERRATRGSTGHG